MVHNFIFHLSCLLFTILLGASHLLYKYWRKSIQNEKNFRNTLNNLLLNNKRMMATMKVASLIPVVYYVRDRKFEILSSLTKSQYSVFDPDVLFMDYDNMLDNVHPEDKHKVEEIYNCVINNKDKSYHGIVRYDYKKKFEHFFNITFEVDKLDDDGNPVTLMGFMQDITEIIKTEIELKNKDMLLAHILDNLNSGLVYINNKFEVEWENVSKRDFEIHYNKFLKGNLCYQKAFNRTEPCDDCLMLKALKSENKVSSTKKILHDKKLELTTTPIYHETTGHFSGIVVRIDDIKDRLDFISGIEKSRDMALQSEELKSAFIANMSHEIRTPLNAVVGFSKLVAWCETDEERNEYLDLIQDNSKLLLTLFNDILDLSKIEAGRMSFENEEFDLRSLIINLIPVYADSLQEEVGLTASLPDHPVNVYYDKQRISQVISNLMINACKFTAEGKIKISLENKDNGVIVSIEDTGCGIEPEKMDNVFMRFEKLDNYTQGSGLGLCISKSIIDACGGTIGAESVVGEGSRFWFFLPMMN